MIKRVALRGRIKRALDRSPIVVMIGPRQCGKTTLAREFLNVESENYFDLEDPLSLSRLDEPMTALRPLRGLIVIDEVQRRPELFPILRVLVDRADNPAKFLILGSASGKLIRQSSESLAGRVERVAISGFTLDELGPDSSEDLWLRGSFPRSYLAHSESSSMVWRREFVQTLMERDFPQWGVKVPATTLSRFWRTLAHYHGQTWNAAKAARALNVSPKTAQSYLDLLSDALMVRQLQPFIANLQKRQVKSPKIYIRDSGLLHQILGVSSLKGLYEHPRNGASWEGLVIEQILSLEAHDEAFFWASHQSAEVDLILRRGDRLFGVECKRTDRPKATASARTALKDLGLEQLVIVYPGPTAFQIEEGIRALPLSALASGEPIFEGAV